MIVGPPEKKEGLAIPDRPNKGKDHLSSFYKSGYNHWVISTFFCGLSCGFLIYLHSNELNPHDALAFGNESRKTKYNMSFLELIDNHHYGEERKSNTAVYFAGIPTRNRFPNE